MMQSNVDLRIGYAIEQLMEPGDAWRALVRDMVARWPDVPPLELSMSLVAAAAAIEGSFTGEGPSAQAAARGYRLAALLSVDYYAMELLGMPRGTARDYLTYWKQDPFFARL